METINSLALYCIFVFINLYTYILYNCISMYKGLHRESFASIQVKKDVIFLCNKLHERITISCFITLWKVVSI